jgi:preprotein translocase subunit SecG
MFTTLMVFHALISVLLILMVLLQFGKGAEAGLLSGGASDAVFSGSQQGNILSRLTLILSVVFVLNCIVLAKLQSSNVGRSLLDSEAPVARPLDPDFTGTQENAEQPAAQENAQEQE